MNGGAPPAFEPVDFTTRSDYASLDEQLERYFKKSASGIIVPLLFSFLPLTFSNGTKSGIALSVFAGASLVSTVLPPVLFAGRSQSQHGDRGNNRRTNQTRDVRRLNKLCFAAYASNILLMLTTVCLASVPNNHFGVVASLVLLIPVFGLGRLIYYGRRNGFIWGALQYRSHQSDLKYFLDLSSDVAQTAVTGLSGNLLGNMKTTRGLEGISKVEALIMCAGVMSLFLMLACTMPPAFHLRSRRQRVADQFLKWAAYSSVALIILAAFFVVADVVGAYGVLAVLIPFLICMVSCSCRRPSAGLLDSSPQGAEARRHAAGERSLMWMGIHSVMFGTMMASYSAFLSGQHLSGLYKAVVLFVFAAQLTNIFRMVLVRETRDGTVDASVVVRVSGIAMVVFMLLALLLLIILAITQPDQLKSTFGVA